MAVSMNTIQVHIIFIQVLVLVFAGNSQNYVSSTSSSFDVETVIDVIESSLRCYGNPGITVSVVKDGQVLLSRGFGVIDLVNRAPVTNSTLFGIASVTKGFAATLLVKLLYEKTNLTEDSYVRELLGDDFTLADPFRSQAATFTDLLAHRTAFPGNNRIRFDTNLTRDNLIRRLPFLSAPDQFRVKFMYSSLLYGLVTWITEVIGGESWEELIKQHLFTPLGMDKSTFATTVDFGRDDVATPYQASPTGYRPGSTAFSRRWGVLAGSGAILSTAEDMTRWMNFHLSNGQNLQGQQVMQSDHLAHVHKAQSIWDKPGKVKVPQFPVTASEDLYALGFVRGYYREHERLMHTGSTMGYRAYLSLLPQANIGVFIALSGRDVGTVFRKSLQMYLLDKALGLNSWLNASTICSYPEPWMPRPKTKPEQKPNPSLRFRLNRDQYVGTYHNEAYGYLHVKWSTTESTLVLHYGFGKWLLYPKNSTRDQVEPMWGKVMNGTELELNSLHFLIKSQGDTNVIVGVNVTGFEKRVPPSFIKLGGNNSGSGCSHDGKTVMIIALLMSLALSNIK